MKDLNIVEKYINDSAYNYYKLSGYEIQKYWQNRSKKIKLSKRMQTVAGVLTGFGVSLLIGRMSFPIISKDTLPLEINKFVGYTSIFSILLGGISLSIPNLVKNKDARFIPLDNDLKDIQKKLKKL